ncbi:DUF2637 domain-containing protein [Streptomyces sp. NPDC059224]|uniref:DUF2637 domain-containing protein n=1 Tax=Streptomyces sp. NPDC059224 TaxID=3346775 RepID=UPI0036A6AC56
MTTVPWALPAALTATGIGAAAAVAMVLGNRRRTAEQNLTAEERTQLALQHRNAWQRRLAVIALGVGCLMMFVLAGIAAWLSFGAQRDYAHVHNGGDWDAATGFALLLDAGALSLSLIRFFEALTVRSSAITRILLLGFVSASAAMNLLDAPETGSGSALLAIVPPLVYAVLLEMLLFKIEQVIMGRQERRKTDRERAYSLLLWLPWPIGAPVKMWKAWRTELLATVDNVRVIGSQRPRPYPAAAEVTVERADSVVDAPAAGAASVNALPPPALQTTAGKAEEPPSAHPAASASAPAITPQQREAATEEARGPTALAEPGPVAVPEAAAEPAAAVAMGSTASLPGEEESQSTREDASGNKEEPEDQEPNLENITSPDEESREETRTRLSTDIDLSVLPKNLSQRQRAERIYVAHQAAGLALSQADLGNWAGYKNPNSGGNEYRRLEKEHGPIIVRVGATHVDLKWSHQPVTV